MWNQISKIKTFPSLYIIGAFLLPAEVMILQQQPVSASRFPDV